MAKFNAKNLAIIIVFGIFLLGTVAIVNAQQLLPQGGDSFGTAVKLEPGSYQRDTLEENEYFYVADIKPGQEINIEYTFSVGTGRDGWAILALYDEDRTELFDDWDTVSQGESESITTSWLPNTDKDSYKYYIKTGYDRYDVGSVSFNVLLIDYYDAGGQTDAGDSFEKAINITPREYNGYLSGKSGADTKDFYKLAAKKGETLTIRTTPEGEARMKVVVYNSDRQIIKEEYAPNPGAIITNSASITKSQDVFVAIVCDEYCSEDLAAYTLNIATEKTSDEEVGLPEGAPMYPEGAPMYPEGTEEVAKAIGKGIAGIIIFWIVGPIVFLIIIGMVIFFLLKKKK